MKLKNKKTGEIIDLSKGSIGVASYGHKIQLQALDRYNKPIWMYSSLAELNEVWEDVPEELKEYWYIDCDGEVYSTDRLNGFDLDRMLNIGNRFNSREEAEQAVEKLKAWKRLKNKIIDHVLEYEFDESTEDIHNNICFSVESYPSVGSDIDLLFGGKNEK